MCNLCETNPVYEFTNKRKLCKTCFIRYFQKKILYTIRKFRMIKQEDIVRYKKGNDLKTIVLENILLFLSEKAGFQIVKMSNKKSNKTATNDSLDSEADRIVNELIKGNASNLDKYLPINKNLIKPLALFLDEEILLYAKIKNLKFKQEKEKKDKITSFIDDLEKKHPEVKRAVVNSLLELYK